MPPLNTDLRRQLENVIIDAREKAEEAAESALTKLAVDAAEPFGHFDAEKRQRRNRLRARGRQVGDVRHANKTQSIDHLTQELAYEYWHRMLFARFLVENDLLVLPDGTKIDLDDCKELAPTEGAANEYVLAARYASRMLPQIFRTDDVLLEIEFPNEQRLPLERLLEDLPSETFQADDGLGWVYQFWQARRKKEVNDSGVKIDGTTLPAVTQLFTEHYMVQFLLHNTVGAWWAAKWKIKGPAGGAGLPPSTILPHTDLDYLRWKDDGTPAAGTFPGWPKSLAEFTLLDPCCGSGHFLVAAFNLLAALRIHDEGLSHEDACDAVLRDNLFGLELDPRCTQIAAFALALAAWKFPSVYGGPLGYRELPPLNIACSGQGVTGKRDEWLALANGDAHLQAGMDRLYDLFEKAPHLGSLIDPRREKTNLAQAGYAELRPLLEQALAAHAGDADLQAVGVAARGITAAADLLAGRYTLVVTNVPYLGRGKQDDVIKEYLDDYYADGKADLATAFVLRCLELCEENGSTALVTPQNWILQGKYEPTRVQTLKKATWNGVVSLGEEAWRSFGIRGPRAILLIQTKTKPRADDHFFGIDLASIRGEPQILIEEKEEQLAGRRPTHVLRLHQASQLQNPDSRIIIGVETEGDLLEVYASGLQGISPADEPRYGRAFWESSLHGEEWHRWQSAPSQTCPYSGREWMLIWDEGLQQAIDEGTAYVRGNSAWGKRGVCVRQMADLPVTLYTGTCFDTNVAVVVPTDPNHVPAIWEFCSSTEYRRAVRRIDQKMNVTNASLVKVPFDLAHWQKVAAEKHPNGLPEPHSNDPTQWLFKGDIASGTNPLQVAVARLLGYRWPDQPAGPDAVDALVDDDGVVCLPRVRGEAPAAERLREVLVAAYGDSWSEAKLTELLTAAGAKAGATLHDWLMNSFFEQHCKRFENRPFIWHVSDGRKDGFSALLNYHKLTYKTLENLTHSYLNDWITAQTTDAKAEKVGADLRLAAAQKLQEKLKLILAGEPPYDIFVRWKPLSEQPIGWNPDLNDGVRQNIRPFVKAGVLRKDLKGIIKESDRGNEPKRDKDQFPWFWNGNEPNMERVNNVHLTTAQKQAARDKLKAKGAKS